MIIVEKAWESDEFSRDFAERMIRKSGSSLTRKNLGENDYENLVYQISMSRVVGISERDLLRMLAASKTVDEVGKTIEDLKGMTRRYADIYKDDESIPLNMRKNQNTRKRSTHTYYKAR